MITFIILFVPQNSVKKKQSFSDILSDVNIGNCLLFVDTIDTAFSIDAKGFKQRSVDSPKNETVIRGAQEAFTEAIRTNTSMIRRFVNNENLVIESLSIGKVTKTQCAVCYMKDIANDDLVAEVKYRLNNLDIDSIISSGQLEQLIEDNSKCSLPQMLSTERPDKAANHLLSGRVVVIVNGSPYVLIMPCVFVDFLSSAEDPNLKFQYANLLKFVRLVAFFYYFVTSRFICCNYKFPSGNYTYRIIICYCCIKRICSISYNCRNFSNGNIF